MLYRISGDTDNIRKAIAAARLHDVTITEAEGDDAPLTGLIPDTFRGWTDIGALGTLTLTQLRALTLGGFLNSFWVPGSVKVKGIVLKYMMAHRIPFADRDPRDVFKTPVEETTLAMKRQLHRGGCLWLELLPYLTERDILRFDNFGPGKVNQLKEELQDLGIQLKN